MSAEIRESAKLSLILISEGLYAVTVPKPKVCPVCGKVTKFVLDRDGDWELDGEWWIDPKVILAEDLSNPETTGYTCSKKCYLARIG